MPAPYYYIDQDDVEEYLGVQLTANGIAMFALLQPLLQDLIDQYCNRTWNFDNPCVETFDALAAVGENTIANYQFFIAHPNISKTPFNNLYPLAGGIQSVLIGQSALDMNYVVSYGTFVKFAASFPSVILANPLGFKMVTITYNSDAVQGAAPLALKMANIQWMARMIQEAPDAGKSTNKVQAGTVIAQYNIDSLVMPKFVQAVLDNYRLQVMDHF